MQAYLKPRTDLCVFTFGGRKFQTDDPENAKLILYKCVCVCVYVMKLTYPYVFVSAQGSYEMGRHK